MVWNHHHCCRLTSKVSYNHTTEWEGVKYPSRDSDTTKRGIWDAIDIKKTWGPRHKPWWGAPPTSTVLHQAAALWRQRAALMIPEHKKSKLICSFKIEGALRLLVWMHDSLNCWETPFCQYIDLFIHSFLNPYLSCKHYMSYLIFWFKWFTQSLNVASTDVFNIKKENSQSWFFYHHALSPR